MEKREKKEKKKFKFNLVRIQGTNFRWVVPQLSAEIWGKKQQFKTDLLDKLMASKTAKKGIKYYSIAIESHADGNPHLDMLIIFEKKIPLKPTELDFLCDKHGNLTRYRSLNQAILDYGSKEDKPLSNCPDTRQLLNEQDLKKDPYMFLQEHMLKDPYSFNIAEFVDQNNYAKHIRGWSSVKIKLKDMQEARCNRLLKNKPGIKEITPELIQQELTPFEQKEYHSWHGYKTIIKYLNEIKKYGWERPFTSKQLYISGKSRIGKSYLIRTLQKYCSAYPVGTQNWFPKFQNFVYKLMIWDECKLNMMSKEQMLQLFDGDPFNLPYKGGSILKRDNQLWLMCSNKTINEQFINMNYDTTKNPITGEYEDEQLNAIKNRIQELVIPEGKDLFVIQKLIHLVE